MTCTDELSKNVDEIRRHVERDRKIALEVKLAARDAGKAVGNASWKGDITGTPKPAKDFLKGQRAQKGAVLGLTREGYFAKVETLTGKPRGETQSLTHLVTQHRFNAGIRGDDWTVTSWTDPITMDILDREVGHVVEFQPEPRSHGMPEKTQRIEITSSAKYGTILPEVADTTYTLAGGSVYLENERLLEKMGTVEAPPLPQSAPEREYEAAQGFGLGEIIELADVDQRAVMHLPFHDTVLVEGPPGSGKTSVGLMRIPCLIDNQWAELGREPNKDAPFHTEATMHVLVLNEEMITYLDKLISSLDVHGVEVETLAKFCQHICHQGKTLPGVRVQETSALTSLKSHPLALQAYWSGFRAALQIYWNRAGRLVQDSLVEAGDQLGRLLARRLDRWVNSVAAADMPTDDSSDALSLAVQLEAWRQDYYRMRSNLRQGTERDALERQMNALEKRLKAVIRRFFNRRRIVRAMTPQAAFQSLCRQAANQSTLKDSVGEWLQQSSSRVQRLSEADYTLGAWLATHVSILPTGTMGSKMGHVKPKLTHVLIDEAQDISPCHIAVVRRLLSDDGTLTLVGDLRQRVTSRGHFAIWNELNVGPVSKVVLEVNHRQSKPLGTFLSALHKQLFNESPTWRASTRLGPRPRVRHLRGNARLAASIADEINYWREQISGATVGILLHDCQWSGLHDLVSEVETSLSETLTDVHFAVEDGNAQNLTKTDCAVFATIAGTKGLEFDAVIVIDPQGMWRQPLGEISLLRRNAMYVAASRARQGLSLILDDRSKLVAGAIDEQLYEQVDHKLLCCGRSAAA